VRYFRKIDFTGVDLYLSSANSYNIAHRDGCQKHTWPKPRDISVSRIHSSLYHRVISVIHIQKLKGTIPTDRKNTNGYRRRMVFLFVEKSLGLGRNRTDLQSRAYHTVTSFGRYRSPGGQISFLASTIEMIHENVAIRARINHGFKRNPHRVPLCRTDSSQTKASCVVEALSQDF
jgi:hypothetical protein